MSKQLVEQKYVPHVAAARERLKTSPALQKLLDPKADPAFVEAFLIQYNSRGVFMTEPVDGWIRRAGEATVRAGMKEVGEKLITHAKHEEGHHLMMVEDAKGLVESWNSKNTEKLDASALLKQTPTQSMVDYRRIHEDTIAGPVPAAQVAIEYEIENLSVVFVPGLLEQAQRVCGEGVLRKMSFLKEHAELDVGHTALNEVMLNKLLEQVSDDKAEIIAKTGAEALDIYLRFLGDCIEQAQGMLKAKVAAA
ncbi:hypothetical protein LZ198_11900 [Myxococcus sp. K15C18031901]|uniref:hypothetical protein n=1 Tax=Myxococcus dinghuensis TaxID=2906761 RepID=UPI0020A8058B|nr:hypothetical protein [Myxococcus dinghuensis]MCP3099570.1 hypothetical protein [Myxococcus dinghuensis]